MGYSLKEEDKNKNRISVFKHTYFTKIHNTTDSSHIYAMKMTRIKIKQLEC